MNERGTALVETLILGLLLLVPLIWALGVLSELHRAALATTTAAREAGFDAARASSRGEASNRVYSAVTTALADHGVDPQRARVEWTSDLERGGLVEIQVSYDVPVFQAPFLGSIGGPSISVSASHAAPIDRYRSRP